MGEGARRALLCVRREGEKRAGQNDTRSRLYFAWMLQGLAAWYAEHSWGGVDGMLRDLVDTNDGLGNARQNVVEAFGHNGWALVVGWTPWVEARLLASLGTGLLRAVPAGKGMRVYQTDYPLQWGKKLVNSNREEADVAFVNERMMDGKGGQGIFRFRGYYVFARREYIRKFIGESGREDFGERVRLAAEGGLRYLPGTDFARVVEKIKEKGGANERGEKMEIRNRGELDSEFEHFIKGERDVFLGGAHHAALLREWWASGEEAPVEVVLSREEVCGLMDDGQGFENRILFADWLRKGPGTKRAREAVAEFFGEIWKALCAALVGRKGEKVAGPLLECIYGGAVGKGEGKEERPWSFLTDWKQLQWICAHDSKAVEVAVPRERTRWQEGRSVQKGRSGKEEQKSGRRGASGDDRTVVHIEEKRSRRR